MSRKKGENSDKHESTYGDGRPICFRALLSFIKESFSDRSFCGVGQFGKPEKKIAYFSFVGQAICSKNLFFF